MVTAVTAVGMSAGVLYGIVRLVERALTLPATIRKANAEADKAQLEAAERARNALHTPNMSTFERQLREREAEKVFSALEERMGRSPIRIADIRIKFVGRKKRKQKKKQK
jgi:hypothetical protein